MDSMIPKDKSATKRVILVFHSLPMSLKKLKLGVWSFHDRSLSSLVSAVASLQENNLISSHVWVGCPISDKFKLIGDEEKEVLDIQLEENSCISVDGITQKLYEESCFSFSQKFLKPLFHYDISNSTFDDSHWRSYKEFNKHFARKIATIYQPGDIIWIHGLQLLLLPKLLRKVLPSSTIGFFLHCPFPAVEVFRCLASRKKILKGMLGSDLVAFQAYSYSRYFIQSCTRILGSHSGFDGVKYRDEKTGKDHLTRVSVFSEGIDPKETELSLSFPQVQKSIDQLKETFKGKKILIAKDQGEAIEATKNKLLAYEQFLRKNPKWIGDIVFFLICEPCQGNTSPSNRDKIISSINETVARINGEFGSVGSIPIEYLSRNIDYEEICSLYYVANIFLSTPLREGMNLDTHDFVACHKDTEPGQLILSEFDGASRCFGGAILVNPWSVSQLSQAISDALNLSPEQTILNHRHNLNYVLTNTSLLWGEAFLYDLLSIRHQSYEDSSQLDIKLLDQSFRMSKKRLFIFDYDGIFNQNSNSPSRIPKKLSSILKKLGKDSKNTIYFFTNRDTDTIEKILDNIPNSVGLGCENGNFLKSSTGFGQHSPEWKHLSEGVDMSWRETVLQILEHFSERLPGSELEINRVTVSWSYENCTFSDYSSEVAQELLTTLIEVSAKAPIDIVHANKSIEIKPSGTGKSHAMKKIIDESPVEIDFILCVGGGDQPETEMFDLLDRQNPNHFAVTVGKKSPFSKYFVSDQNQILRALDMISSPINSVSPIPFNSISIE
eukprot:gene9716-11931_t